VKKKGKEQDALLVSSSMPGKKKGSQAGTKIAKPNHLKYHATRLSLRDCTGFGS